SRARARCTRSVKKPTVVTAATAITSAAAIRVTSPARQSRTRSRQASANSLGRRIQNLNAETPGRAANHGAVRISPGTPERDPRPDRKERHDRHLEFSAPLRFNLDLDLPSGPGSGGSISAVDEPAGGEAQHPVAAPGQRLVVRHHDEGGAAFPVQAEQELY